MARLGPGYWFSKAEVSSLANTQGRRCNALAGHPSPLPSVLSFPVLVEPFLNKT